MERYERVSLADGVVELNYKAGDYIIKQGEVGDRFYFLFEGEAVATKTLEYGKGPLEVMQYFGGSYFGELALINDMPRAANVIAKNDCNILSLDKETFKRVMGSADELIQRNVTKYGKYSREI